MSGAILGILSSPALPARAQTNAISLDRIIYLTANLDSLSRHMAKEGFEVKTGPYARFGPQSNTISLPSGQILELSSPFTVPVATPHTTLFPALLTPDSDDWRQSAIAQYGTHTAGIILRVSSVVQLVHVFDSLSIPHGAIQKNGDGLAFGLEGPQPLDISFISSDSIMQQIQAWDSTASGTGNLLTDKQFTHVSWLLLTASPKSEAMLRNVFSALRLTRGHEGCCDYWMIGPPDNRVGLRFELPTTTFFGSGNWLSIEPGGVVFAY